MAKSLQEQLLAAGAVKKDRAARLKKAKHKQGKQQLRGAAGDDDIKRSATLAQAEKLERDRELSRVQQHEREVKARAAQLRQLIVSNRIDTDAGDSPYNFADGKLVHKLFVTGAQQTALANGKLAVARLDDGYALVPAAIAAKLRERDADVVVLLNAATTADVDDPYADYQVPDDLTW